MDFKKIGMGFVYFVVFTIVLKQVAKRVGFVANLVG